MNQNNENLTFNPSSTPATLFVNEVKRKVFFYRNVFLLLGIIFLCLTEIIFFHSPNWHFKLIFGHVTSLKTFISLLSGSLALVSLWLGCSIRTGFEAIAENARKAKRKLKKIYLSSQLSPIDTQKYFLIKEEIDLITKQAIQELEKIEKSKLPEKEKQSQLLKLIETQKLQIASMMIYID
ncbi:MAG: hypothetical protein ACSNEK_08775 [Parachlamydiaceae bacterium]